MFIPRHVYDALNNRAVHAEAIEKHLQTENASLTAHVAWMQVRLTELSMERAMMLKRYLNIDVPVPSFEQVDNHPDMNQTIDFNDIGDKAAAALGLDWDADGNLTHTK